jgi:hypothetical protein
MGNPGIIRDFSEISTVYAAYAPHLDVIQTLMFLLLQDQYYFCNYGRENPDFSKYIRVATLPEMIYTWKREF